MRARTKNGRIAATAALAACAAGFGGCARSVAWDWTGGAGAPAASPMHAGAPGGPGGPGDAGGIDPGVAVFARSGMAVGGSGDETTRRDAVISSRDPEAIPDRLAWPVAPRADLRRTGSVRTSRSPERWVYPDTRRDAWRGSSWRHDRVYPPYRGW